MIYCTSEENFLGGSNVGMFEMKANKDIQKVLFCRADILMQDCMNSNDRKRA